jgi:hypothetical protein
MLEAFPETRVGDPVRYDDLTVFPLFTTTTSPLAYLMADEAMAAGLVVVEEVSEGGSVPVLKATNRAESPVLFLEGEELRGAKQNRILNTTILVAAHGRAAIPVSCVEAGRWQYRSRRFSSSGAHVHSRLRHALRASVSRSLRSGMGHRSDQHAVWQEVDRLQSSLGTSSPTHALADSFDAHRDRIVDLHAKVPYVPGASGAAVAIRGTLVSVDLFDQPATCEKAWRRILSGLALDALEARSDAKPDREEDVTRDLETARTAHWEEVQAAGLGAEYRSTTGHLLGTALVVDGVPVHLSLVAER